MTSPFGLGIWGPACAIVAWVSVSWRGTDSVPRCVVSVISFIITRESIEKVDFFASRFSEKNFREKRIQFWFNYFYSYTILHAKRYQIHPTIYTFHSSICETQRGCIDAWAQWDRTKRYGAALWVYARARLENHEGFSHWWGICSLITQRNDTTSICEWIYWWCSSVDRYDRPEKRIFSWLWWYNIWYPGIFHPKRCRLSYQSYDPIFLYQSMKIDTWLTSRDMDTVRAIFQKYTGISRVKIFGSRAKWNYRKWSDIDLAIEWSYEQFRLMNDFEESSLPYFVDIVDPASCTNIDLIDHIERVWQVIYETR